jgi:hypothetical protein
MRPLHEEVHDPRFVLNGTKASSFRFPGDWSRSASRFPKRNDLPKEKLMLKYVVTAAAVALLSVPAYAAQDAMPPAAKVETAVPANAVTVTDWYKQDVYDPNDKKMGQIKDCWSTSPARSTRWSSASAASKRLTD